MKGLQTGIPLAVLAAVARAQMFEVGGNHGDDNGNGASLSFDQTHNTGINNAASNDQKASYNALAKGKWGGPFRRHDPDEDYVGGNYGDDNGNTIGHSQKQGSGTKVGSHADNHKDDSVNKLGDFDDFLRKRQAHVGGNSGDDSGNEASLGGAQSVNTDIKNKWESQENVTVNIVDKEHHKHPEPEHHCHKCEKKHEEHGKREIGVLSPIRKRFGPGHMRVGGNYGNDNGNGLDLSMDQGQNTAVNNDYSNKQSTSANALAAAKVKPWFKRGHVGGNHGDDNGNALDLDGDQSVNTKIDNDWKNDEKVSENAVAKAKGAHGKRFGPQIFGVGGNHGNDRGNDLDFSADQTQNTEINNKAKNKQDLSKNKLGEFKVGVPFLPKRHHHPDPFHGVIPEGPVYTVGGNYGDDGGNDFGYSGDQTDNHEINNDYSNEQKASINAAKKLGFGHFKRAYRPTTPEEPTVSHAANNPEAACATETREVVQTVTETVYAQPTSSAVASQPSDPIQMAPMATPTPTSAHIPMTTVVEASTYHMIPVFVPEVSTPVSSAAVASSSHVPASSSASIPTSVDAYRPGAASSQATPSPSSHAGVVFDGAAGHVTPHTGLVSLLCGVVALLAFVY